MKSKHKHNKTPPPPQPSAVCASQTLKREHLLEGSYFKQDTTMTYRMAHTRRKMPLAKRGQANIMLATIAAFSLSILHILVPSAADAGVGIMSNNLNGQQYSNQRSSSPNNLVIANIPSVQQNVDQLTRVNRIPSSPTQAQAQNMPLIRQQMQMSDLDDVIESTTTPQQQTEYSTARQQLLFQPSSMHPLALQMQHYPSSSCQLPPTWVGKWYQANKDPIRVTNTEISDKGICRDKKGDKYLFEYSKPSSSLASVIGGQQQQQQQQQQNSCLICLVINERHLNVLQYKESSCQPIPSHYLNRTNNLQQLDQDDHSLLDTICSDITGDAQLESLFRLDTPPIECPISGKYNFFYNDCKDPHSSLDSCIDKKQLNFKFSACPDIPGSESKTEQYKCYADWSEGNNYYMIGRLNYASNPADVGKFRCFIYEKSPDGEGYISMAQSVEESCYGLPNANEGPKTLRLMPRQQSNNQKCHYPAYIRGQSENWLSVDNSLIYMFNANSTKYQVKETREGNIIEEAACLQQYNVPSSQAHAASQQPRQIGLSRRFSASGGQVFNQALGSDQAQQPITSRSPALQTINDVIYLIQITKNCQTTDYCVRFHQRTSGIVQIDYFIALPGVDIGHRCRNAFTMMPQTQIITSTNLEQQRCPFEGAYTIEAPSESDLSFNPSNIFICPRQSFLSAQCEHPSRMRIHYKCSSQNAAVQMPAKQMIKNFYCLGSWTSNGLVRLLLADDERQRYSAWYRDYGTVNNQPTEAQDDLTRSQHLLAVSAQQQQQQRVASIVDLQIALITPMPTVAKPMQARLTRRNQCADIRNYLATGQASSSSSAWFGYGQSSNLPLSLIPASGYASIGSSACWMHAGALFGPANVVNMTVVIFVTLLILRASHTSRALNVRGHVWQAT